MKTVATLLAMGFLCATVTEAQADSKPKTHDGFHFQLQTGLGYYSSSSDVQDFSGMTIPIGLLMGGTVGPIALGGGLVVDYAPSPSADPDAGVDFKQYVIELGIYADYFADSIKEGLHFQGMVGWGGLETSVDGNAGGSDPTGLMLHVGVGYDVWISDQWKAGGMFRLVYGSPAINGVTYTTIEPAVVGTITWH